MSPIQWHFNIYFLATDIMLNSLKIEKFVAQSSKNTFNKLYDLKKNKLKRLRKKNQIPFKNYIIL